MKPSVLRCPSCGAVSETPASASPVPCAYCKAALHPARCPWCFTWAFAESKACPGCEAEAPAPGAPLSCPSCRVALSGRSLGGVRLDGCPSCGGVWTDPASLRRLCEDRAAKAAYLGDGSLSAPPKPRDPSATPVRYRPCAVCGDMMNRVNFAGASGVIIDACRPHGTWFDADELAAIAAFVRGGGLDAARERDMRRLQDELRRLRAHERPQPGPPVAYDPDTLGFTVSAARGIFKAIFG
ncbi:MAG: zf-TFIIB domain-containing protein [Elusimicrobiota bacterium]|nr:zf-TFIIB domain-containing protein [Elusimicrobiota bacterium]